MFSNQQNQEVDDSQLLQQALKELDEIKRYVAATYEKTDNEISEIKNLCKKIDRKLIETDNQVNRIETYERTLNEIRSHVKNMERKIK